MYTVPVRNQHKTKMLILTLFQSMSLDIHCLLYLYLMGGPILKGFLGKVPPPIDGLLPTQAAIDFSIQFLMVFGLTLALRAISLIGTLS